MSNNTMSNNKLIVQINQLFHNKGIKQESRFDLLTELIENNKNNKKTTVNDEHKEIVALINSLDYENKDLIQELFMLMGSKFTKFKLDQFYTPLTISEFICNLMLVGDEHKAIDPAGGTGDLLLYYKGHKTIWDIDANALKLCKFNYELNKQSNYELLCKNSLLDFESAEGTYSYVTINPPFGSSTLITDKEILDKFTLGKGRKKQEIGILFAELGLKLLKNDGIMFIIMPAGYVGNTSKCCFELRELLLKNRVIASIELPKNTFKRSGTGVNTYLLIVQKKMVVTACSYISVPYNLFISSVENIGYNLTKKDTPLKYKLVKYTGDVLCDEQEKPIVDNDFKDINNSFVKFCSDNNINGFTTVADDDDDEDDDDEDFVYECVESTKLHETILDIKRYMNVYLSVVNRLTGLKAVSVNALAKIVKTNTKTVSTDMYKYIDISVINSPFYSYKEMYGWELPSRAKYTLKKYDILVSKLEGSMSYCVILDDTPNYIATNGVAVIRPNDMRSLYILITNIMRKDFTIQHNAFLTGSIMASLSDADIGGFLIDDKTIDLETTRKILETLETLHKLRA